MPYQNDSTALGYQLSTEHFVDNKILLEVSPLQTLEYCKMATASLSASVSLDLSTSVVDGKHKPHSTSSSSMSGLSPHSRVDKDSRPRFDTRVSNISQPAIPNRGEKARRAIYLAKKRLPKTHLLTTLGYGGDATARTRPSSVASEIPSQGVETLMSGLLRKRPRHGRGDFGQPRLFRLTPSKLVFFHSTHDVSPLAIHVFRSPN